MEASKIVFSGPEQRLIADAEIILTKNRCIDKIVELFGELSTNYRNSCNHLARISPAIFGIHPKISKGEKHRELPWVMLDYPRCFDKVNGQLAVRTFFWWGNFFSIQLQVSGKYFGMATDTILRNQHFDSWMTGITMDPWDMRLPNEEWMPLENYKSCPQEPEPVLKLAKKIPIDQWESLINFSEDFELLVPLMESALSTEPVK